MIFVYLVFWLPALLLLALMGSDYLDNKKFFDKAKEAKAKIIGTIGAQNKRLVVSAGQMMSNMVTATGQLASEDGRTGGGVFLRVEYETEDGDVYEGRSKQSFNEVPDSVTVQYDPEDPSDIAVDGYYMNLSLVGRGIGFLALILTPIIISLL